MIAHVSAETLETTREAINICLLAHRTSTGRRPNSFDLEEVHLIEAHSFITWILDRKQDTYKVVVLRPEVTR
jgi:hypothetical protein